MLRITLANYSDTGCAVRCRRDNNQTQQVVPGKFEMRSRLRTDGSELPTLTKHALAGPPSRVTDEKHALAGHSQRATEKKHIISRLLDSYYRVEEERAP